MYNGEAMVKETKNKKKYKEVIFTAQFSAMIVNEFRKLNPDHIVPERTINEIIYLATSPRAERTLHNGPSFPGMPRPQFPNSWKRCNYKTSRNEIENVRKAAKQVEKAYISMHCDTVSAFVLANKNPQEIEVITKKILDATNAADKIVTKLKEMNPEWESWKSGRPLKAVPLRITKILANEFNLAKGKKPTISNRQVIINANQTGNKAYGQFLDLITNVFLILNIKASPEAMARKAITFRKK